MTVTKFAVLGALLVVMAAAVIVLARTKLLPLKFLLVICALLLVLLAVVALLVWDTRKKGRFWIGAGMAALLAMVLIIGCVAGIQGTRTMQIVTSPAYAFANIGVYVREDDSAQALEELSDRTFGIMGLLGRNDVDEAIKNLNETLKTTIQTTEYDGPVQLVDALLAGQVDAAILDVTFIEGLAQLDEYQDIMSRVRQVTDVYVQLPVEPTAEPEDTAVTEDTGKVFTALISGIDSRGGLVSSSLSDVNILVTVNTATHQVLMVSTPRDFFVTFPNTGMKDKLTHAGYYGIDTCMGTLGALYGVNVDYYFRVNFGGFVNIINALGGITVDSEVAFSAGGYQFSKGENTLNGDQALVFARERKSFVDGDRQRGRNQMAVIRAVMKKAMSPELLRSYSSLLGAVDDSFQTTVPYDLIAELVRQQLDEGGDWNIVSYSAAGSDSSAVSPLLGMNVYVMEPDMASVDTAKDLMQQVRDGKTITAP